MIEEPPQMSTMLHSLPPNPRCQVVAVAVMFVMAAVTVQVAASLGRGGGVVGAMVPMVVVGVVTTEHVQ